MKNKMTYFVVVLITFIFTMATPIFAYATDLPVCVEEDEVTILPIDDDTIANSDAFEEIAIPIKLVDDDGGDYTEEGEWYHYYDLNNDGKISVSDLVMIKEAVEARGTLAVSDYELVYEFILTGTWKSKMNLMSTSLDRRVYNEETIHLMSVYTGGELVDIQIDGDVLTIRHLNDHVITEIRSSHRNLHSVISPLYVFDLQDKHITIQLDENGSFVWNSWKKHIEIDGPKWSLYSANMTAYYDLNKDGLLDVFDMIEARRLAFESDKLSFDDAVALQGYLLTGKWQYEMHYEMTDLSDMEYSPECVDMITNLTYGQLVDYYISNTTGKIWLRFLNNLTIREIVLPRDSLFLKVKDITLNENYDAIISVGYTAEDKLAWSWVWDYIEGENVN